MPAERAGMKLLLDSHVLLWAAGATRRLPRAARALPEDEANELVFSAASLWEVAIKQELEREDFRADARLLSLPADRRAGWVDWWTRGASPWNH